MQINRLNKKTSYLDRFLEIIYKNFLDLRNKNVGHTKEEILRILTSDHSRSYYLIINNKIVGYIITEDIVIKDGRFTNYIYYLYISSKHRGKGYSKFLLDLLNKESKGQAVPSVMLIVDKNNVIAQNLYFKNGFVNDNYDGVDPRFIALIKYF